MEKDILKQNRIPGCDQLTRPEEISALSKYLGGIKKVQEEHTKLGKDILGVPGRDTGKLPEIETLETHREGLENVGNNIKTLPGTRIELGKEILDTELDRTRLDLTDIPEPKLDNTREELDIQDNLDTLPGHREELGGGVKDLILPETREDLEVTDSPDFLPDYKEDLGGIVEEHELSEYISDIPGLSDNLDTLSDHREELGGEIEDISELGKTRLDIQDNGTQDITKLPSEKLDIDVDTEITSLPKGRESMSTPTSEVTKLSESREELAGTIIEPELEKNRENITGLIPDSDLSEYVDNIPDKGEKEISDLPGLRENLGGEVPDHELSDHVTNIPVHPTELDNLLSHREELVGELKSQELSEVLEKILDSQEVQELESGKIILQSPTQDLSSLETYRVDINNRKDITELPDLVEKLGDHNETGELSDYVEELKIQETDVELPDISVELGGEILNTDNLPDARIDIQDSQDIQELGSPKDVLPGELISSNLGEELLRLKNIQDIDKLETSQEKLQGTISTETLEDTRLELGGEIRDPRLNDFSEKLVIPDGPESLGTESIKTPGSIIEPDLSEVIESRPGEEIETILEDTRLELENTGAGPENLSDTRIDILSAPEPDLSDYLDSLLDVPETEGLEDEVGTIPGTIKEAELVEDSLLRPGENIEVIDLPKDVLLRPGETTDQELGDKIISLEQPASDYEIPELPGNVLASPNGGEGYSEFQDNVDLKTAEKGGGYYDSVYTTPDPDAPGGNGDNYFYDRFEWINEEALGREDSFSAMWKGKQPPKPKAAAPEGQETGDGNNYSYDAFLKTLDISDPAEATPDKLYNRAIIKLEDFGELGEKIQPLMSSYLSGSKISPTSAEEYRRRLEDSILPALIDEKGGGGTKTANPDDDRKTQSRLSGMPRYKLPKFNIGMINASSYIRWAAESTVGAIDYGKVGDVAAKLGMNLRETLIKETIDALIFARDKAERATKSNRDRLPGDDMGLIGDLVSGGASGALGSLKKGLYDSAVSAITGTEIVPPLNRPSKNKPTEAWTAANKRISMSDPSAAEGSEKKGFMKKLGEGLKDMAIGSLGGGADKNYKFQDNYLKGEGINLTLKGLCLNSNASSIGSVEALFEALRKSPYMSTPEKFMSTGYNQGNVQTLDSNAYWEIVLSPYTGNLNGNVSYLPAIEEINTRNMIYHGVVTKYNSWIPFTSFDLQKSKMTSKTLGLYDGEITYPVSMEFINELRVTIADDQFKSWRTYFETCMEVATYNSEPHDVKYYNNYSSGLTVVDKNYPLVAFYKNLTFQCDIYVMTPQYSTIKRFTLFLVLKDFSQEYSGEIDSGGTDLNVSFSIVGENSEDQGTINETLGKKYLEDITSDNYVKDTKPANGSITAAASTPTPKVTTLP